MNTRIVLALVCLASVSGCDLSQILDSSGPDGVVAQVGPDGSSATGGSGSNEFVYQANNPPGRETWEVTKADRDAAKLWALYQSPDDSSLKEFWALDFFSNSWTLQVAGDIVDIEPSLYLEKVQSNPTLYRLQYVTGTEVNMDLFNDGLSGGIQRIASGGANGSITLFYGTETWRNRNACCPRWEKLVDPRRSSPAALEGVWSRPSGGVLAATTSGLWEVGTANFDTSVGWTQIAGIGGGRLNVAFDNDLGTVYATSGCSLYEIENSQATLIDANLGQGAFGSSTCASGFGSLAIDVDDPHIYLPFGMQYTGEALRSAWLGGPSPADPDFATLLPVFNQAYSPKYIFVGPSHVWVYQRQALAEAPDAGGGWLRIQDPLILPWKDPHPFSQN